MVRKEKANQWRWNEKENCHKKKCGKQQVPDSLEQLGSSQQQKKTARRIRLTASQLLRNIPRELTPLTSVSSAEKPPERRWKGERMKRAKKDRPETPTSRRHRPRLTPRTINKNIISHSRQNASPNPDGGGGALSRDRMESFIGDLRDRLVCRLHVPLRRLDREEVAPHASIS